MGDKTGIEWCEATWNPVVGCSVVSPGCTNCYAMRQAARIERMATVSEFREELLTTVHDCRSHYAGTTQETKGGPVWTGKIALAPEHILTMPLRWKRPREIFVNSMGDLFHESVLEEWIDRVFAVMALSPQHTFIVLTKRSKRMREYAAGVIKDQNLGLSRFGIAAVATGLRGPTGSLPPWPLPNVVLGVSTEDQTRADERIPDLLAAPAAKRVVSAEPLLGEIDFTALQGNFWRPDGGTSVDMRIDALTGRMVAAWNGRSTQLSGRPRIPRLDGVIVGGESGKGARPMELDWSRSIVRQCSAAGVACFVKQLGANPRGAAYAHLRLKDRKGGDLSEWPDDLRVRELCWR